MNSDHIPAGAGRCAKAHVECVITVKAGFFTRIITGSNWCRTPQRGCPRLPGEDYAKCKTVCNQVGHAELDALRIASEAGVSVQGGTATLRGHTYMCQGCQEALWGAGVLNLRREPA